MEMRSLFRTLAAAACAALPAAAQADLGAASELFVTSALIDDNGAKSIMHWSSGSAHVGVLPRSPLMNAGSADVGDSPRAAYERLVDETAATVGLDSELLHAVIHVESGYNARAVSPQGAIGLMQLMPETAKRYRVFNLFDPAQNVRGGARYLRDLIDMFGNDVSLALAAYNAGEQAVVRNGNRIPRWKETMAFVGRVLAYYRHGSIR